MESHLQRVTGRPWMIAIAGLMGAGKTTLAKQIVRAFGWRYVPSASAAKEYVHDLFNQPSRWAFEAQTALFCSKALEICECLADGYNIVVDRSLEEDASIFAPYFHSNGHIDNRGFATYTSIAADFLKRAGPPDFTLFCSISPSVAWQRIRSRGRGEEHYYPQDHLERLATEYSNWSSSYRAAPLFTLDSEKLDWRKPDIAGQICREIAFIFEHLSGQTEQLTLFAGQEEVAAPVFEPRLITMPLGLAINRQAEDFSAPFLASSLATEIRKTAYLAAPYTGIIEVPQQIPEEQRRLYDLSPQHGRIPVGPYRAALLATARALREYDFHVILPHRDVSSWGDTALRAKDIMQQCTEHVRRSELFVGMLAESCGSHYEFGLALAMGKPCILISSEDFKESVLAQGADVLGRMNGIQRERVLHIRISKFEDAPAALRTRAVAEFIKSS